MKRLLCIGFLLCFVLLPFCVKAEGIYEFSWMIPVTTDVVLPDNEQLFSAYAEQRMSPESSLSVVPKGTLGYDSLSPRSKRLYEYLKTRITEIADGKRTSSQFIITDPEGDLGYAYSYTAEDLGVSTLISDNALTTDANNAFLAAVARDMGYVHTMDALFYDTPYELYWYQREIGFNVWIYCRTDGQSVWLSQINFELQVASPYGSGTDVDTSVTGKPAEAARNAQAIVARHAAEDDRTKLESYKDEICALNTYNEDARDNGIQNNVVEPWQLIYVFDGDSSTNVVCEGYTKAFQYLCDLSTFEEDVDCYHVSGDMKINVLPDLPSGHAWNLVRINSVSYLVDITNSEPGTIGEHGQLFMQATPSSGTWDTQYLFDLGNNCIVAYSYGYQMAGLWGEEVLTLGCRSHVPVTDPALPATHITTGLTEGSHCAACGEVLIPQESLPIVEVPWIILPAGLNTLEEQAFTGSLVACVIIPEECTVIEAATFADCAALRFIEIPATVSSIQSDAFSGCSDQLIIVTPEGSYADTFAKQHGIICINP